jgi:hypothetical protein
MNVKQTIESVKAWALRMGYRLLQLWKQVLR